MDELTRLEQYVRRSVGRYVQRLDPTLQLPTENETKQNPIAAVLQYGDVSTRHEGKIQLRADEKGVIPFAALPLSDMSMEEWFAPYYVGPEEMAADYEQIMQNACNEYHTSHSPNAIWRLLAIIYQQLSRANMQSIHIQDHLHVLIKEAYWLNPRQNSWEWFWWTVLGVDVWISNNRPSLPLPLLRFCIKRTISRCCNPRAFLHADEIQMALINGTDVNVFNYAKWTLAAYTAVNHVLFEWRDCIDRDVLRIACAAYKHLFNIRRRVYPLVHQHWVNTFHFAFKQLSNDRDLQDKFEQYDAYGFFADIISDYEREAVDHGVYFAECTMKRLHEDPFVCVSVEQRASQTMQNIRRAYVRILSAAKMPAFAGWVARIQQDIKQEEDEEEKKRNMSVVSENNEDQQIQFLQGDAADVQLSPSSQDAAAVEQAVNIAVESMEKANAEVPPPDGWVSAATLPNLTIVTFADVCEATEKADLSGVFGMS
jgi:hypothetical protein